MNSWDAVPYWPDIMDVDPNPHEYDYTALVRWWTRFGTFIVRVEVVDVSIASEATYRLFVEKRELQDVTKLNWIDQAGWFLILPCAEANNSEEILAKAVTLRQHLERYVVAAML